MLFKPLFFASLAAATVTVYDYDACENSEPATSSIESTVPETTVMASTAVSSPTGFSTLASKVIHAASGVDLTVVSLSTGLSTLVSIIVSSPSIFDPSTAVLPTGFSTVVSNPISSSFISSTAGSLPTGVSSLVPTAVSSAPGVVPTASTSSVFSGLGTWYGETCGEEGCWNNGPCSFVDYILPATIDGSTCVSEDIWNDGYNCGACVEIMYKGKKKIAMITNKTGGNATHLDMTPDMFSQVADKSLGGIDIKWEFVSCPISAPLEIRMHGGASQWWFAATVENATLRTAKMEVSTDSGKTWKATTRNINNFFELSTLGGGTSTTTAWIRVTSETGSQVIVESVNMASGTVTTATTNYQ